MNDRRLFLQALKLPAGEQRIAWLTQACGDDGALRVKLIEMVQRHEAGEPIPSQWLEPAPLSTVVGSEVDSNASGWETMAPVSSSDAVESHGAANSHAIESLERLLGQLPRVELRRAGSEPAGGSRLTPPTAVPAPGSRYQVLGEIARGGMGVVLKGRDVELGRELAIKVLLDRHKDHPEVVQRFVEEAQIGGQLQHPGIAPVYELGQFADHRLFFSMKLVKGQTLAQLLHERQDPTSERIRFLEVFKQICQTMAYAHSRGVIHRDLKPANIMVGAFGEVQVMDWGLAKVLSTGTTAETTTPAKPTVDDAIQTLRSGTGSDISRATGISGSQTQMGSVMGTPAYMPPEQALGEVDTLDERADVFGLGAILGEILTGQPPYLAEDSLEIHRLAARGALQDCFARLATCGADVELIALTKQCLEVEPAARPRHAGVLADCITDYLDSVEQRLRSAEVQRATESARAEEAVQTAMMHQAAARAERRARRFQVGLAVVVVVVLAIGGLAASWSAYVQDQLKREAQQAASDAKIAKNEQTRLREIADAARKDAEREEDRAKTAMRRAENEANSALNMLADMHTDRGLQAGRNGQSAEAALWFANAARLTPGDPHRASANHRRAQTWLDNATKPVAMFTRGNEQFRHVQFQPAGPFAMLLSDGRMDVWNWRAGVALPWPESYRDVLWATWSPDGKLLAISFRSREVHLVEPDSGKVAHRFTNSEPAELVVWSPDGQRLALARDMVQVWRVTGEPTRELELRHPRRVYGMSFNRAGTRLVTGCEDDLARVFAIGDDSSDAPLFAPLEHAPRNKNQLSAPAFCDDDRQIVTILKKKLPALWNATNGELASPAWRFPPYTVDRSIAVHPSGRWIAIGAYRSCMLLGLDGRSFELIHSNHVDFARFCPDGRSLLTTCYDNLARQWSLDDVDLSLNISSTPIVTPVLSTFSGGTYSDDGRCFALNNGQHICVWERGRVTNLIGTIPWVDESWLPRSSADGRLVTPGARHSYAGTWSARGNELSVVRVEDGQRAGPTIKLNGLLYDSCICSDNRSVAAVTVSGEQGWLTVYDIESGRPCFPARELPATPMSVSARPGHDELAVLSRDGALQVLDSRTGEQKFQVTHEGWKYRDASHCHVNYSPDGETLVSVDFNSRVFVRDPQTGQTRYRPLDTVIADGSCRALAFSNDSRRMATAAVGQNIVRVWDVATGEKVGVELPHPGDVFGIWSVCFSPDGQHVLTGHKDGRLRIWDWKSGQLVNASMQNPDEVTDATYTADGRHIVAAVRLSAVHVWDVATGKPATPIADDLFMPGDSAECVRIAGNRAVVTKGFQYYILDLEKVLRPPQDTIDSLVRRSELATNTRLNGSEIMLLSPAEWNVRWEREMALRKTRAATMPTPSGRRGD